MIEGIDVAQYRKPEHDVLPVFIDRWSPRAMSGETIAQEKLMSLFEAARWAPSSYNNQPWRFLYAARDGQHWDAFFDLLVEGNQKWAKNAAVLIALVSKTTFDRNGKPSPTHSFDCGAAWQNLALQGASMGLVVHGMEGFDKEKARKVLAVPDDHEVEVMIAVGRPGDPADLPENYRDMEKPSGRKALEEIVYEGKFQG